MTRTLSRASRSALLLIALLAGCDGGNPDDHDDHAGHSAEGASSDDVHLTPVQVENVGVRTEEAVAGAIETRLRLTAVVQENQDAQAHLTPKVPGLVRSIRKNLGDHVTAGEIVCQLDSTELGKAVSTYLESRAQRDATDQLLTRERTLCEQGVAIARTILERERGLKDKEITTLRPYYQAEKDLAQAQLMRDSRVLQLEAQLRQHEIRLHSAEEQLRILGLGKEKIAKLSEEGEGAHGLYPVRTPRAGVIVARHITQNEFVGTESKLFLVQDLSRVWVVASVYEKDLRAVRTGQDAVVRLEAFPGAEVRGKITFIDFRIDPVSRACDVRLELPNELAGWKEPFPIRPGMFATVEIVLESREAAVTIPESAIVHEGNREYVFVALGAPEHDDDDDHDASGEARAHEGQGDDAEQRFVRREVVLGPGGGDRVEIVRGVKAGERVVVEGTFALKSLARQGELGGGHSH